MDRTQKLDNPSLMTARELDPRAIQGDRFDPNDSDDSYQPDLEEEPDSPADILPDQVRTMPGVNPEDEDSPELSARPMEDRNRHAIPPAELPEG